MSTMAPLLLLALLVLNPELVSAKVLLQVRQTTDNYNETSETEQMNCDEARLKCLYRDGCGRALNFYLGSCARKLHEDITYCPRECHYALVGLMSTDEGKDMMNCKCAEGDIYCTRSRRQAEICRSSVEAVLNSERVSCRAATFICSADTLCGTAYNFYTELCKRMFIGKKCTKRCMNSIDILRRQEKAAKLNECYCDGPEDHECLNIQRNMQELCFERANRHKSKTEVDRGGGGNAESGTGLTVYRPESGWSSSNGNNFDTEDTSTIHRLPDNVSQATLLSSRALLLLLAYVLCSFVL